MDEIIDTNEVFFEYWAKLTHKNKLMKSFLNTGEKLIIINMF